MDSSNKQHSNLMSLTSNGLLFLVCISGILIIILASNLDLFCIPKHSRAFNISNEELFLIYTVVFTIINIFLLKLSSGLKYPRSKMRKITLGAVLIIQLVIMSMLFIIYGQIKISSLYHSTLFYTMIYLSLVSSAAFLAIAAIQFLRWFIRSKNYLVMTYALVMLILCTNSIIGAIYLSEVSLSHSETVKYKSCSVMMGVLNNPNPEAINILANLYDITSFFSFILAWLVTVLMLKEYTKHRNKLVYWIIFALPLIFFLPRYEISLYYFSSHQVDNILTAINLNSDIYGYQTLNTLLNSNLQVGGAFFGMAVIVIAAKLTSEREQRKSLIVTGIGMMFLFASKDISTLIISSYPPLGAVSIAFMSIASYMVYAGIHNTAAHAARDKKLRRDLRVNVENNVKLLRSIASSQDRIEMEKNVKELMNLTTHLQKEDKQPYLTPDLTPDLTQNEIRDIVNDVILELKKTKKKS
jgi:hypothetical protein